MFEGLQWAKTERTVQRRSPTANFYAIDCESVAVIGVATEVLLREAFATMDIVTLREYEAEVAKGSGHLSRSALIGSVARRR